MKHLLAIDPGGTKCSAVLVAPDGTALAWNLSEVKGVTGRHISAISSACLPVIASAADEPLCVAAIDKTLSVASAMRLFPRGTQFFSITEAESAMVLANENYGVVVLAGTGAFTHLLTKAGRCFHLDGEGPLIGDFGGGFWIGQSALRAMARHHGHSRHATSLSRIIKTVFTRKDLCRITYLDVDANDRMTVASLAVAVNREAEAGDRVSREILFNAAHELAETVFDALDNFDLLDSDYPLIGTGSVICRSSILWERFVENVKSFAPNIRFQRLTQYPAVVGVALAGAKSLLPEHLYGDYRKKLLDSFFNIAGDSGVAQKEKI